jgi:hypothetical protein
MEDVEFARPIARSVRYLIAMRIKVMKTLRSPKIRARAVSETRGWESDIWIFRYKVTRRVVGEDEN